MAATAAQAVLGKDFRVTKQRGEWAATDVTDLAIVPPVLGS